MTPAPLIRPAVEEDIAGIVGVYVRAYAQPPWNERNEAEPSERYLRWVIALPDTHCLVAAADDGTIAGFILAGRRDYADFVDDWERMAQRPVEGWPHPLAPLGYIWEFAVDPVGQRRGTGTALLDASIAAVSNQGVRTLLLRSSERAAAAVSLYRRAGFVRLPVQEVRDPLSGPWALTLIQR